MTNFRNIAAVALISLPAPALAHHPLGGMPMETFAHGVLSGVGHPVLGFDHLFFVLAMGLAASFTARAGLSVGSYLLAMLAGVLVSASVGALPLQEGVIALSLVVVGGVLISGRALAMAPALALFAGFGLFHGAAFGETIAAQEAVMGTQVLIGYLLGLGVLQAALALAAGAVLRRVWDVTGAAGLPARLAGGAVAGMGALLTLEYAEGLVFAAFGWAA